MRSRNLGGSDLSRNLLQLSNHRVKHCAVLDANGQINQPIQTGAIVEERWRSASRLPRISPKDFARCHPLS